MAFGAQSRNAEPLDAAQLEIRRELVKFFVRVNTFHRGNGALLSAHATSNPQKLGQIREGSRNHQIVQVWRLPGFDALAYHGCILEPQLDYGLAQEFRFFVAAVALKTLKMGA